MGHTNRNRGRWANGSAPYSSRPGGVTCTHITIGIETRDKLKEIAISRGTTFGRFAGDLLDTIVWDDLVNSILDDG